MKSQIKIVCRFIYTKNDIKAKAMVKGFQELKCMSKNYKMDGVRIKTFHKELHITNLIGTNFIPCLVILENWEDPM